MSDQQDDIALLRRQGYHLTSQRLLVLDVLKSASEHLPAETIHGKGAAQFPLINVATAYRNLEWLHDAGGLSARSTWATHICSRNMPALPMTTI